MRRSPRRRSSRGDDHLEAAQITAVSAYERATAVLRIPVDEVCELLSLIGDIADGQDSPILHVHDVLGLSDGTTGGGHLLEEWVFPKLEAVVTETSAALRKVMRPIWASRS